MVMNATYSPEDNKLRLYSSTRLDQETYQKVRNAGFIWAPKQELFVAPTWTPEREDLLIELCGEVGDEDTSLVERAEERSDRFHDYSRARAEDAVQAQKAVETICDGIPLGQPILVGHHSERHARKDAERIENGMRKAVKLWDTSQYWKERARGAIRNAKYKERPDVRARRIKGLEADKRRHEKTVKESELFTKMWQKEELTTERAKAIANYDHISRCFPLATFPRELPASQYEGAMSLWSALSDGIITGEQGRDIAIPEHQSRMADAARWLNHINNRLEYERAMLGESGGVASEKFNIEVGGRILVGSEWVVVLRINKKDGQIMSLSTTRRYVPVVGIENVKDYRAPEGNDAEKVKAATRLPPMCNYPEGCRAMTSEEWKRKPSDYKGSRIIEANENHGRHRVRYAMFTGYESAQVYISDAKLVNPPATESKHPTPTFNREVLFAPAPCQQEEKKSEASLEASFGAMRETLRQGVKVVSAPQLFPTPPDLARRMVQFADVQPGQRVLEPSAGTGNIVREIMNAFTKANCGLVVAVELNASLSEELRRTRDRTVYANESNCEIVQGDFLEQNGNLGTFHRIVMNPPFENGTDIKHIKHATTLLKPGGRLVSLCANGPRQQEQLKPLADTWEELLDGTFKEQGTGVNVAMLVINKPQETPQQELARLKAQLAAMQA